MSTDLAHDLLVWYDRTARDLPWRGSGDPYRVLVSEFMLQQTQVATVIPYFQRFITRFPDVTALAEAPADEVLRYWEGLGYYGRARRLHEAARRIVARFDGRIPEQVSQLRELPGVGAYTAGAVASIAYGQKVPAIDGNVLRVVARLLNLQEPVDRSSGRAAVESALAQWIPEDRPGDFNQGLMELGARVCRPRFPDCVRCPVAPHCRGRANPEVARLPFKSKGQGTLAEWEVRVIVAVDRASPRDWTGKLATGQILLVRRRPGGLLAGMWALPAFESPSGHSSASPWSTGDASPGGTGSEEKGIRGMESDGTVMDGPLCAFTHTFSHRRWRLQVYGVAPLTDGFVDKWRDSMEALLGAGGTEARWVPAANLRDFPLPRPFRRVLDAVGSQVRVPFDR